MAPLLPTGFPGPPFGGPSAIGGLGPTGGERGGPSPTSPLPVAKQSVKISISAGLRRMINYTKGLPLLTRVVVVAILITYFLDVILGVPLRDKWALDPRKMSLSQMHRINTYPVIHTGALHAGVNLIVLTPLLERFEREIGTLKTTLLIAGPVVTIPAALYLGIEMGIVGGSAPVVGSSGLIFTLLAAESVKTYRFNPYYTIGGWEIPTWPTPIFWMVIASFLMPTSSLLGHFCAIVVGYAYACRYLRLLEPNEWILTRVEKYLGFILLKLPWYVGLHKRVELNHMEMLPMAVSSVGRRNIEVMESGFSLPGRTLGSA